MNLSQTPTLHHFRILHLQTSSIIPACISPAQKRAFETSTQDTETNPTFSSVNNQEEDGSLVDAEYKRETFSVNENIWNQMKEIVKFSGPAVGLWLYGPLMSLIDTVVIGQGSSIELAALGPGTVFCDYTSYVFMFLSIATSNLVATSLAKQDKDEVQHQISSLLFIGLACGVFMLLFAHGH